MRPLYFTRTFFLQPLTLKNKNFFPNRTLRKFFLSFSDAFLCIINHCKISQNEYILIPNFYCLETLSFIEKHLKIIFYKINDDFSVNKDSYFDQIKKYRPRIIMNYCLLGFSLNEMERKKLIILIQKNTIIIDDYSQIIIHHNDINPLTKNHFYIDSIRKHSPFLGAHLINDNFLYNSKEVQKINVYKIKCHILRMMSGFLNLLSYFNQSNKLFRLSHRVFLSLNTVIGDPKNPTKGNALSFFFYRFLNLDKIQKHNKKLAIEYTLYFNQLKNPLIKTLPLGVVESSNLLSYYPLFVDKKIYKPLTNYLLDRNIFVDQLWEFKNTGHKDINKNLYDSFVSFPLVWLIKEKSAAMIYRAVKEFLNTDIKNHKNYD